ncbi:hypothetical protein [Campylobacter rectus]|uniref:hypothetical protein n=1 Tax=Campylobacter rectus TaxID=203 RepID=UPI000F5F3AF5|nr:hypothetical protein [Campylobacter rectus]RRD52036.1 hypothetical protein EII16_11570 [Campylobacter rectus]
MKFKISAHDRYQILRARKANLDVKFNPSEQNRAANSTANLRAEKPKTMPNLRLNRSNLIKFE